MSCGRGTLVVFFLGEDVLYLFHLLENKDHLRFSLPNLERISRVLFVQLDQGLLELQNFLIRQMNLRHHVLLLLLVEEALFALAIAWHSIGLRRRPLIVDQMRDATFSCWVGEELLGLRVSSMAVACGEQLLLAVVADPVLGFFLGLTGPRVHRRVLRDEGIGLVGDIGLELGLELVDLIAQVGNDILVSRYVLADHLLVRLDAHLNILGSVRVLQRIDSLFVLLCGRRAGGDHDRFAVATE